MAVITSLYQISFKNISSIIITIIIIILLNVFKYKRFNYCLLILLSSCKTIETLGSLQFNIFICSSNI